MIAITKDEAQALRNKFRNVCIVRLCKCKSKRHHYLCEEIPQTLQVIADIRGCNVSDLITD